MGKVILHVVLAPPGRHPRAAQFEACSGWLERRDGRRWTRPAPLAGPRRGP